jgi:hypothetical protein
MHGIISSGSRHSYASSAFSLGPPTPTSADDEARIFQASPFSGCWAEIRTEVKIKTLWENKCSSLINIAVRTCVLLSFVPQVALEDIIEHSARQLSMKVNIYIIPKSVHKGEIEAVIGFNSSNGGRSIERCISNVFARQRKSRK